MDVVELRFIERLPVLFAMDHAAVHGDCVFEDGIEKGRRASMSHGVDTTLRKGQVDRLCEV